MRVYVADDHAFVRTGIKQVLRELGGFDIVGEAENGRQVLNDEALKRTDVLVLDLSLPLVSGPEVLRRVRRTYPSVAVVVLSMHPEEQFAERALAAGAAAYVSKERPPQELVDAVRRAGRGEVDPREGAVEEAPPHTQLTRREHQIFMRVVNGHTVTEVAAELDVHACTVSNHLAKVRTKLGLSTVAEMVRYALTHGLLSAGPTFDG
ncbi:MAG: response regulator transcription factor [Myxococcales bacterium]|nr:response regulator transcription factor [Myxococcales bacterium]MCB9525433.1 response regulator transcription factor [Myxococcales bacterium]